LETANVRAALERRKARTALAAALLIGGLTTITPARAQFSWFGPSEASPQDIYDTISEHGFRLVGPLYRNGRVYLADVVDRRQRRERLVIAAESGQIVQRFLVDFGDAGGRRTAAVRPPPADDSFFSRLTRGWDDEPPPRPPLGLDNGDTVQVPAPTRRREPRVVTRTEGTVPPPAPVTATPLPSGTTAKPDAAPPATASAPAGTPPASGRGTTVSTDPLRLPGTRPTEPAKPAPTVASKAPAPPAPAAPPPAPATPAPAAPQAKPADVPVAPLD
jgi:hypothetical protein